MLVQRRWLPVQLNATGVDVGNVGFAFGRTRQHLHRVALPDPAFPVDLQAGALIGRSGGTLGSTRVFSRVGLDGVFDQKGSRRFQSISKNERKITQNIKRL